MEFAPLANAKYVADEPTYVTSAVAADRILGICGSTMYIREDGTRSDRESALTDRERYKRFKAQQRRECSSPPEHERVLLSGIDRANRLTAEKGQVLWSTGATLNKYMQRACK